MKKLVFLLPIAAAFGLWEIISRSGIVRIFLFPPPSRVAVALWEMAASGLLWNDLRVSLWRLLAGLIVGVAAGIIAGLLTGKLEFLNKILSPILRALRPLPPVAIIPLIIVWFGIGDVAKIFSIAFAVFFPAWANTYSGVKNIPDTFIWSARLLTRSKFKLFSKVLFPAALPFIIEGVRTAIALGFIMVFVSELAGASSGLGYRISINELAYRIDDMMAGLIVLGLLGALADLLFTRSTNLVFPWLKYK